MIHIRIDDNELNKDAKFACGIGWPLPRGDKYWFVREANANRADCPGCNPAGPRQIGTPISELSGRPGEKRYAEFIRIARSWGYE